MNLWDFFEEKYGFQPQDFIAEDDIDEAESMSDLKSLESVATLRAFAEIVRDAPAPDDNDFEIDPEGLQRFLDAVEFFMELCAKHNGTMDKIELQPHKKHGYITAYLPTIDFDEREVTGFCKALEPCVALDIGSRTDRTICVSFTLRDVFRDKV